MLLALVMVVGMLPVQAFATETEQITEETSVTEPVVLETTAPVVETAEPSQTTEETSAPETVPQETAAATEPAVETMEDTAATEETVAPVETEAAEETVAETVEETEPAEEAQIVATRECYNVVPSVSMPSSEELFAAYAEQQFYGEMAAFGTAAGRRLSGDEKLAYDALVPVIKQIANGQRASATIAVGVSLGKVTFGDGSTGVYNADVEVAFNGTTFTGQSLHNVATALMADMPYEMYWYDKTIGVSDLVIVAGSQMHIVFDFAVANPYRGSDLLTANTAKTGAAKAAAANAKAVVDSIAADKNIKTDYDKLVAYRDWICANVSYNTNAANSNNFSENVDPWQMIYVFDGDSSTNVVCEGYSKAFQYLCDLSEFDADITCYSVSGIMAGGTGAGNHMWNILEINGKRYLVDVTNSDSGTVGAGGGLFLVGGTANANGAYTFNGVSFTYDSETKEMWNGTGVLTLDTVNYTPAGAGSGSAEAALREGLAASVGKEYTMNESVTLTEDLTINLRSEENPWLIGFGIGRGATLTVPSGVTLTVISSMWIEGELILEDGATLVVGKTNDQYGTGVNLHGKLTAASGATVKLNNSGSIYVYDGATVSGIPNEKLVCERTVSTLAELKSAMTLTGYRQVQAFIDGNVTLAETLTIPAGFNVYCLNSDESFTIANGGHLIVDGFFSIQNGATLNIHAGGVMTINGNAISYGGILNNNGTINGYFQVNSQGGQELSEADFVAAVENCNGYYNLVDHVVITGDVTIPDNVYVWVSEPGSLTVAEGGKLTISQNGGQLSTGNSRIEINGTLVNNGYMSLDFSGNGGEIKIASTGKYRNNSILFVGSGTLALDGTYTGGSNAWVSYDPDATITNISKIGTENIYLQDIVSTEAELIAAMVLRGDYSGQSVCVNDDIILTKNLTVPAGLHLEIGYSWRSDEENQYGLTVANGVTLTNESGISVGEKFYLHINSGATLVNDGYVSVYGSYVCNGTVTGNTVEVSGGAITQDEFEQLIADAGENWVNMGQQVILERDLTIDNNFSVNGPKGSIVVPSGVTLTVNGFMGILGQVTVEAGGKIVMGQEASISVDGQGNLTFESGANLSGLRKGQIHYYPAYGATINGLDNSYVEMVCEADTLEDLQNAISDASNGYHTVRIEVVAPFDISEDITVPANVRLNIYNHLADGRVKMNIAATLTNKGSMEIGYGVTLEVSDFVNQGDVNVYEEGMLRAENLTNTASGSLWNYGGTIIVEGAYDNKGRVEGNVTVNGASSATDALQEALNNSAANGQDYVHSTKLTLDKDLTINMNGNAFYLNEGGWIIVPDGVKLTVESNVQLNGGKIIVQSGGWVQTTNGAMIDAGNGVFFVETGAMYDIRANWAIIEAEGDAETGLVAYNCNDNGSGVTVDWGNPSTAMHIMPGMWYQGLICIREFNKTEYEWHNTIIQHDQLETGAHLTAMALADTEHPPVFAEDDEYVESYAVALIADRVFAESHIGYTLRGVTYTIPVTIGPGNQGFFSKPEATEENYLGFNYTIDPEAEENSFYYMFFGDKDGWKIENFKVIDNPFDQNEIDQVTWTKVSDTVYKITVKPECWDQRFPVHVQVGVSNANYGMSNTWGIGQLWVEPAMSYDPWLGFVWLNNNGDGWYENPEDEPNRMEGMWSQDEFYGVFYQHQWDASKQLWIGTPVIPTVTSDYITITPVKDIPGHTIKTGQNHANYFVQVKGNGPLEGASGGKLNFTCNGTAMSQDFDLYPCEIGWYDANETTLDAFISAGGGNVELDYSKAENAYYLKLLYPGQHSIKSFSWGVNTWGEDYNQYVSDGEFITMTDLGNGTYKFTVDPEFVVMTKYNWKNFCLYADVQYGNASGTMNNGWHGEIWVNPPEGERQQAGAEFIVNGEAYSFYEDLKAPMRWEFTGDYDEWGNEIWNLVKAELPAGVSYDLASNTLTLNNATLEELQFNYLWMDENGNPLPESEAGTRLPDHNVFLKLVGSNTINGQDGRAAIVVYNGANLNVVGNGTLTITGNGENYVAMDVAPNATACFQSGTIRLENTNLWFGGIIDWDGTTLIGNNSYFDVDQMLTLTSGSITLNGGAFHANANMTMNGGEIVLNDSMLYNGTAFNQNGGTITANINGGENPAIVAACYYALNGGEINISQNNGLPAMAVRGTFHQMGGTVDIRGDMGINVVTAWDDSGNVVVDENGNKRVGSLLLNDGVMNITGTSGGKIAGIDVNPESSAFFGGGTLNLTNAHICNGGVIDMTHMAEGSAMTVNLNNGDFYVDNSFVMQDGYLHINNGTLYVTVAAEIHGGQLVIHNENENGIYVANYLAINGGNIAVTTNGMPAIQVDGIYHQMGGTVYAADEAKQVPGFGSNGSLLLNAGELTVSGLFGLEHNSEKIFQVINGTMTAEGVDFGMYLNGPAEWNGGSVTVRASGIVGDNGDTYCPEAVVVSENGELAVRGGNHTLVADGETGAQMRRKGLSLRHGQLAMEGGTLNIDADMALYSVSDSLTNTNINGNVGFLNVSSDEYLEITSREFTETAESGDYFHTVMDGNDYAGKVIVSVVEGEISMTQTKLESLLREAAANGTGVVLGENLTLTRDLVLNAHLTIKNNAQLIVPAGVTLTNETDRVLAMVSGGSLSVSGDLVNYGYLNVGEYQQASLSVSGTLTNYGVFRVFEDGTAEIGGYLKNMRPDDLTEQRGLVIAYGVLNAEEVYNSRWICADGGTIHITGRLENAGELSHDNGGKITVDTVMNYADAILNVFNGHLTVTNVLNNNGEIHANQGSINVSGRYIHGTSAVVYYANYDGTAVTINGIDPGYQTMTYNGNNASQLVALLNECSAKGYGTALVYITGNMTLPQDLKFSDNVKVWVQGNSTTATTLTIPAGKTLELHGNLVIERTGIVAVQGTLKNYGGIHVHGVLNKAETAAVYNGTFMNVYADGRVTANGDGWSGYDPWKIADSAIIEGTSMGMTQSKFEHWLAEAERVGYTMELSQVVTLTKDLTIGADVTITNGGGIVVPKGITLTLNSGLSFEVHDGGYIVVDAGGSLVNNTSFWLYKGAKMEVNGTATNNKWFQVGRYSEDSSNNAVLELNGTFHNNYWMHLYPGAIMNVNEGAVLNAKYTFDEGNYRGYIHVYGGQLNVAGALNNYLGIGVQDNGVINVMSTGVWKNIMSGNVWGETNIGANGTVNLMGTMVNDTTVYVGGSNAKFLTYAGSKLTNNGNLSNEKQDAIMDLTQTAYTYGQNAYVTVRYFEDGSVSAILGVPNDQTLLHLYETAEESVINAMTKYGHDNGYLAQIVHCYNNTIDEELFLQPGTELLVHPSWDNNGNPIPSTLTLDANVEIMQGAGIFVQQGSKLVVGENARLINRDRIMIWENSQLVVYGRLDTYPGSETVAWADAVMMIGENATVINRQAAFVGEVGSHVIINGKAINNRGDMLALGTYELGENAEVRNSAFNGVVSNMQGYQAKDLHLDAYFTEGVTQENVTSILNHIKSNGYRTGVLYALTDMALNTLEIPSNVTMYIGNQDENGQVIPVTVTVNGQVTNYGMIQERAGGKLIMNGTLVGMPPVDESGNTDFITQAELEAMLQAGGQVTLNKRVFVSGALEINDTLNIVDGGELIIAKGGVVTLTGRIELFRNDGGTTPGMLNVQTGGKLVNNGEIVVHLPADGASPTVEVKGTYVHGTTVTGEKAVVWSNCIIGGPTAINGIAKSYQTLYFASGMDSWITEFFTVANGYGVAEAHMTGDMALENNMVIPANGELYVDSGTLTVPKGITLSNWGKLLVVEDGHLVVEGTILGNDPIVGEDNSNIIPLSQFKQELEATVASGQPYNLTKRVILTEDLVLSEGMELNIVGGALVVTNKAKLINNGVISTSVTSGGEIIVEEGSKFTNNATLYVGSDGVKMAPGSYVHGAQAMVYVNYSNTENGYTVANVEGVDKSYQTLQFRRDGMWSELAAQFFQVAQGYRGGLMKIIGGMTVDQELTVPANVIVRLGDDEFCELKVTDYLTNYGTIVLASGSSLTVGDCWLNNYGKLEINGDADIAGTVDNYGQLINRGTINGEGKIYSVPAGVTDAGSIHCRLVYNAYVSTETELSNAVAAGVQLVMVTKDITLTKPITIPADVEIYIQEDVTVTVNMNGNITNNGWISLHGKMVFVKGAVDGYKVDVYDGGKIENAPEDAFVLVGVQPVSFEFTADRLVAPTGVPVELFVKNVQPIGADYVDYTFEILDYNPDKAYIDPETSMLYGWDEGPVTVRAKLVLGYDENGEPIYSDITADVTVNFVIQGAYFDFAVTADDNEGPVLYSGERVTLNGELRQLHKAAGTNENGEEYTYMDIGAPSNLTGTKFVWELEEDDDAYASLSVRGNTATLTANNVTERQTVTLRAKAEDGSAWEFYQTFTILPKLEKTALYADGQDVTGKTITFDVNVQRAEDLIMDMDLISTPEDALNDNLWFNTRSGWMPAVSWSSSDETIAMVNDQGELTFTGATGTVKITAATNTSVKKSATVTINVIETPDEIEIVDPVTDLMGGQNVTYKAQGVFRKNDGTEEKIGLLNTAVKWSLLDENGNVVANDPYAVMTADGKLTTKAVEAPYSIRVSAEYTIGGTVKTDVETITLYPEVNNIEILDGDIAVNNTTMLNDLGADYRQMTLSVKGYPANDSIKEVQWKSSDAKIAQIDAEGKITITGVPGTVTFTATALDHKNTKKTATVKVTYGYFVKSIDVLDQDGNAVYGEITLESSGKMTLTAKTSVFGADGSDIDLASAGTMRSNQINEPTNPKVTWTLKNAADSAYLTVRDGALTAKTINNPVTVEVVVSAQDGFGASKTIKVNIKPATVKVEGQATSPLLLRAESAEGAYVTKATVLVEYNKDNNKTLALFTENGTAESWTTSNARVATVDANGVVTVIGKGTANITAKAADGRTAMVTIKGDKLSAAVVVEAKDSLESGFVVASGKALNLTGTVYYTDGTKDTSVNWVVTDAQGNATTAAKVSTTGAVNATANLTEPTTVYVQAMAKDGKAVSEKIAVTIKPLATGVQIGNADLGILNNLKMTWDFGTNGTDKLQLNAEVFAENACKKVKWTSSSKTVAEVDDNGLVTFYKAGNVTITATTTDGSNKKAAVTLTVSKLMTHLELKSDAPIVVMGGKSVKLAPYAVVDTDATNQKLNWEILSGSDFATIATSGELKAKNVTQMQTVVVQASATDGSGLTATATVTLYPATAKVGIWMRNGTEFLADVTGQTVTAYDGDTLYLGAKTVPFDTMMFDGTAQWQWTSSDTTGSVVVDGNGVVTVVGGGITATITAKATDGSNKTATVKIKTIQPVESIDFAQDLLLAGGMSLDLSKLVTFNHGGVQPTNTKLTWKVDAMGAAYATINANGTLKAMKIDVPKTITVYAMATDGSNVYGMVDVALYPATTKLIILRNAVNVSGKTIELFLGGPEGTDRAELDIQTTPAAAMQTMKWSVAAADRQYITLVDAYGNEVSELIGSNPVVKALMGGKTATLTATTMDGTNKKETVKIKTTQLITDLDLEDQILASGGRLDLTTKIKFNEGNSQPAKKTLKWEILSGGDYATINNGTLVAKTVTEAKVVTIRATAADIVGSKVSTTREDDGSEVTVTIYPKTTKLTVTNATDSNKQTITLNIRRDSNGEIVRDSHTFQVDIQPATAYNKVKWSVSAQDKDFASIDPDTGMITVLKGGKTVTVTVSSQDGSNAKATVKVNTVQLVTDLDVSDSILGVGKSLNLNAGVIYNKNETQPTEKALTWRLANEADKEYVSLTAKTGVLRATKLPDGKNSYTVKVIAETTDGSGIVKTANVEIRPAIKTLKIEQIENGVATDVTNKTVILYLGRHGQDEVKFRVNTDPDTAFQDMQWYSNGPDYADIVANEDGVITVKALRGGKTVNINAVARDGSGTKSVVKIQTIQLMEDMNIKDQPVGDTIHVAAGKSLTLKVDVIPTNVTNKNVTWEILGGEGADYVTLSATGTLKVDKDLPRDMELQMRVAAKDESGLYKDFTVKLYKQITMSIRLTAPTTTIAVGHSVQMVARSLPSANNMTAAQKWVWTSSNEKTATVDEYGIVTALAAGTVTITCKAVDGSGKTATIKITVTN